MNWTVGRLSMGQRGRRGWRGWLCAGVCWLAACEPMSQATADDASPSGTAQSTSGAAQPDGELPLVDAASLAADDVQDVWLLAPPGPGCLLRFHIRRAGISFAVAWGEFLVEQFEQLDRNGDFLLDDAEFNRGLWEIVPPQRRALGQRSLPRIDFLALDQAPDDNFVSLDELLAALGASGVHARTPTVVGGGVSETDYLYELLDADGNGRVSAAEADRAPRLIDRWDTNGDEALAPSEIVLALAVLRQASTIDSRLPSLPKRYIIAPPNNLTFGEIGEELWVASQSRDPASDGDFMRRGAAFVTGRSAGAASSPADGAATAPADANAWAALLSNHRPDAEFVVSIDAAGQTTLSRVRDAGAGSASGGAKVAAKARQTQVNLSDGTWIGVETTDPASFNENQTQANFKQYDGDNNGYLDRREAASFGYASTFSRMDADRNNQVFLEEFVPFLRGQRELTLRRTDLWVRAQSSVMIRALQDATDDGLLSPAELRTAGRRVREYDRNGDGEFSLDERVERFQITVGAGEGDLNADRQFDQRPVLPLGYVAADPRSGGSGVPWFDGMDANRDGLVSRREFLGTPAEFAGWDRDGDDLIAAEEVQAPPTVESNSAKPVDP